MFLLGLDPTKPAKPEDEESSYIFKARLMSEYIDDSDDEIDELCKEIEQSPDVIAIENKAMEVIELSSDEETEVDKAWKNKLSQGKDPSPPPINWKPVPGCRFSPTPELSSPSNYSVRPCYVRVRKISADLIDDDDEPAKASRTHKGSRSSKGKRTSKTLSKTKNRNSSDSKSPRSSKENLKTTIKHLPKQSSPESSSNESKSSSNSRKTKKRDSDRSPIRSASELKHNRVKENEKQSLNNIKKLAVLVDPDLEPIVLKPLKIKKKKIVKKAAADAANTDERECVRSSNPGKLIIRRKSIAEVMEATVAKVSAAAKPSTRNSKEANDRITNGTLPDAKKCVLSKYKIPKISSNMVNQPKAGANLNGSACPFDFTEDDASSPFEVKKPRAMPPRRMTFCSGGDQSSSFLPFYPRKPVAIVEAQPIPKRRSSVYDPNPEKKTPKRKMSTSEPKAAKNRRLSTMETDDDMFKKASAMRESSAKMPPRRVSTDEYKSKSEIANIQKHRAQKLKEVALKNKPEGASTSKQLEPKTQQELSRAIELEAFAAKSKVKVTTKNRGDFLTELEPAAASKPPMKLPEVISKAANASNIEKVKGANDSKINSIREKYLRTAITSATVNDGVAEDIQFRTVHESRWNKRFLQPIVPMVPIQPIVPVQPATSSAGFYKPIQLSQEANLNITLQAPEPTSPSQFPVSILKDPLYPRPRLNRSVSFKPDQDLVAVKCYELDSEEPEVYDRFAFQLNPTVPLQPRRYSLPEFRTHQPFQSYSEHKMSKIQLYRPLPNTP